MKAIRLLVAKHYCGGEFAGVDDTEDTHGDTLFTFLMREADDAADMKEFTNMLDSAIDQLRSLRGELE